MVKLIVGSREDYVVRAAISEALEAYALASYLHSEESEEKPNIDTYTDNLADKIYRFLQHTVNLSME